MTEVLNKTSGDVAHGAGRAKKHLLIAGVFFGLVAAGYLVPLFSPIGNLGIHDWPQWLTYLGISRKCMLNFHQIPLWNPYLHGGNLLLAHTYDGSLSLFFLPILIWGEVVGSKIVILLLLFLGMFGAYSLALKYEIKGPGAALVGVLWGLNGWLAMNIAVGHLDHIFILLLPWLLIFYERSLKRPIFSLAASALLALLLLSGATYPFVWSVVFLLAYGFFLCFREKRMRPLSRIMLILLLALGLSAVKLLPMMDFFRASTPVGRDYSGSGLKVLARALLKRGQTLRPDFVGRYGSWEYGAYLGVISIVLFAAGCFFFIKKNWPLFCAGIVALVISFGVDSPVYLYGLMVETPIFGSLHVPFRFIVLVLLVISLAAGRGLWEPIKFVARRGGKTAKFIALFAYLLVALVTLDLVLVHRDLFSPLFTFKPPEAKSEAPFRQAWAQRYPGPLPKLRGRLPGRLALGMYLNFLQNKGTINAPDPLHLKWHAIPEHRDDYSGEAFLLKSQEAPHITYFSPNKLKVEGKTEARDFLILNQNFHPGWRIFANGKKAKAISKNGLIAAEVEGGEFVLLFYYLSGSFILGAALSSMTMAGFALALIWRRFIRHRSSE